MFWIAAAIVIVVFFWYSATLRKQDALSGRTTPLPPAPRVDPDDFRASVVAAVAAGDLPLAAALIDGELQPSLADAGGALQAMLDIAAADNVDMTACTASARVARCAMQHFTVVATALETVAARVNETTISALPSEAETDALMLPIREDMRSSAWVGKLISQFDEVSSNVGLLKSSEGNLPQMLHCARLIRASARACTMRLVAAEKWFQAVDASGLR